MVIRYKYINKITKLLNSDSTNNKDNYSFNYFLKLYTNNLKYSFELLRYNTIWTQIYIFRFFFWFFYKQNNFFNFKKFITLYKFLLNYINLLIYLKENFSNYYIYFDIFDILNIKINKIVYRKFINYLFRLKKVSLLIYFTSKNKDNYYNLVNLKYNVYTINILELNLLVFFLFINNLINNK